MKIVNDNASLTLCEVKVYGDDTPVVGELFFSHCVSEIV